MPSWFPCPATTKTLGTKGEGDTATPHRHYRALHRGVKMKMEKKKMMMMMIEYYSSRAASRGRLVREAVSGKHP